MVGGGAGGRGGGGLRFGWRVGRAGPVSGSWVAFGFRFAGFILLNIYYDLIILKDTSLLDKIQCQYHL